MKKIRAILRPFFSKYFGKYLFVGVINTIFGFSIIFFLMWLEIPQITPQVANLIGYFCGFILSYFLNKHFTFESKNSHRRDFSRFAIVMICAYLINLAVLKICLNYGLNKYFAQIVAGVFYTISGFIFNRFFAFKGA